MPDANFTHAVQALLEQKLSMPVNVLEMPQMRGGSINTARRVRTDQGTFFLKHNNSADYPRMFHLEQKGLDLLRSVGVFRIPEVIGVTETGGEDVLVLEMIDAGTPHFDFWVDFGRQLAAMHRNSNPQFGLDYDNYMGSLPQNNTFRDSWAAFMGEHRLLPILKKAVDSGKAEPELIAPMERLVARLPEIFPEEKPALLHGDLWSGNFMADLSGEPVLFDPAVYYGHREMDLAMSRLFGGFEPAFYHAYQEEWPLEKGWEERVALCNLYPLLVHVQLFVGSYVQSVRNILARFK